MLRGLRFLSPNTEVKTWHPDVVLAKGDSIGSVVKSVWGLELCVKLRSLHLTCIAGFWASAAIQNLKERIQLKYRLKVNADC